ncbi:trypsin-like peptidase domain-containing protein [Acinetobacter sp. ANC 4636]
MFSFDSPSFPLEVLSSKSLYIEMYFEETLLANGTGFLVARDKEKRCVFFTNKHNVTGKNPIDGKHISPTAAEPTHIVIYFHKNLDEAIGEWLPIKLPLYRDDGTKYWYEHPTLGSHVDVVALNLEWGSDVRTLPYYLDLDLDDAPLDIVPSETVSVIGFPFGLTTYGKFPIWSTGFLAQELGLINKDNPVFLIDCRTRQGQSGSAVVAFRKGTYRTIDLEKGKITQHTAANKSIWKFLGIYCGRVNKESDLGRVWHVSIFPELYDLAVNDYEERKKKAKEKESFIEKVEVK